MIPLAPSTRVGPQSAVWGGRGRPSLAGALAGSAVAALILGSLGVRSKNFRAACVRVWWRRLSRGRRSAGLRGCICGACLCRSILVSLDLRFQSRSCSATLGYDRRLDARAAGVRVAGPLPALAHGVSHAHRASVNAPVALQIAAQDVVPCRHPHPFLCSNWIAAGHVRTQRADGDLKRQVHGIRLPGQNIPGHGPD